MAIVDEGLLKREIADAKITLNHNIAELVRVEAMVEQVKETITSTRGAVNAFEYLIQERLKEPETDEQPNLTTSTGVGEEA